MGEHVKQNVKNKCLWHLNSKDLSITDFIRKVDNFDDSIMKRDIKG